jgi:hypothetical protein
MAPLLTHLVIGERVHPLVEQLAQAETTLGAFLLGCLLVDVNAFSDIDRRETHFVGRPHEVGEDAFSEGSARFLERRDSLLQRPWDALPADERAFIAGYLCHLASDEAWKEIGWRALWGMGITSLDELPVPAGVLLTAYSVLAAARHRDVSVVAAALRDAAVPGVLTHVPHRALLHMWDVLKPHALDGRTPASYLRMLERRGVSAIEVAVQREQHEIHMDEALTLAEQLFDIETVLQAAVDRSVEAIPRLWD